MIRTKADVEFHNEGYGSTRSPAVNVKVRKGLDDVRLPLELGRYSDDGGKTIIPIHSDPGFTHEWVETHISERDLNETWWDIAIQNGWEFLQEEAEYIWDSGVKVYSEGRSGGWAVVHGIPDFESWDAMALTNWRRFAKAARGVADDIPLSMLGLIYMNVYEPALEAREALDTVRDWRKGVELVEAAHILEGGTQAHDVHG